MSLHTYPFYDPPEPRFYCADCDSYDRCQCDRDYAEYLAAWIAAVESGEFDDPEYRADSARINEMQEAA